MKLQDGTAKFRVRDKNEDRVPTGIVQFFAGSSAPSGWLVCDGSAVSRTDYEELFEVIGTMYGAGDGSTTFNLPNLIDRFAEGGKNVGTKKKAGLPDITGSFEVGFYSGGSIPSILGTGAFTNINVHRKGSYTSDDAGIQSTQTRFDASRCNSIYGSSDTVQPPSLVLLPIIKY